MAGFILTELKCSDGGVEKVFGPSKTWKALLLLIEHESSHSSWRLAGNGGVRGVLAGNGGVRGVCDTNAPMTTANIAIRASILDMVPARDFEGDVC